MTATAPQPPFRLTRATPADLPEIIALQYTAFPPVARELFMGCASEADLPRCTASYARVMQTNEHDVWIKVVDTASGAVVAASNWKIYPNGSAPPPSSANDEPPDWLEGEARKRAARVLGAMNQARREAHPGGFVHLQICFTAAAYRRRGAGAMMIQWGCDLADQLFLPAWLEASSDGNYLYRRYGFEELGAVKGEVEEVYMRRVAKVSIIEGGIRAVDG
ncbi:Uu.00g080640.m01.CDS01 [Anthostomella pinea]|uniref:Uu.00g080640.m01.CDS01 n=1 Tax=Anthostomella pinea TaxID=933095 RepID=A0AAI8VFM6_9PEZI|nr:Uu.00g080640.m01.CDS01 [Anthostomella pinea]